MAGTTVHYERKGNKEEILAPGPIKEPLHIMVGERTIYKTRRLNHETHV